MVLGVGVRFMVCRNPVHTKRSVNELHFKRLYILSARQKQLKLLAPGERQPEYGKNHEMMVRR
jgi:hypothetical protein